jgi:hypothetical protein
LDDTSVQSAAMNFAPTATSLFMKLSIVAQVAGNDGTKPIQHSESFEICSIDRCRRMNHEISYVPIVLQQGQELEVD